MKVGDMVRVVHESTPDLVGIVIDINENPAPHLDPLPYRVQ